MEIIHLDNSNRHMWQKYVENHPDSTFYHRHEWKEVMEKSFGHKTYYLMAVDKNTVRGILPIVHLKSLFFGSIFCSMPFLNFGGICADNKAAEGALLSEAKEILKASNGEYLELRHKKKSSADLPTKTNKVSMTMELDADPDTLWKNFKSKHRTNIRRAYKNDLEIKAGGEELLRDCYNIISEGWRDFGIPFYRFSFFENILDYFKNSVEIYLVLYEGKPIASAFNGLFKNTIEGMWIYSLRKYAKLQTNYFIYWEMIKRACENGYKIYNFGRSTNESGATFFKSKWNATTEQLYWEYILNKGTELPELNVDNPKYQGAINLWKKLPVKATQLIGPYLAKSIP